MTSAVLTTPGWRVAAAQPQAATGPAPEPLPSPVFIHDAVMPWRGETMLLSILREQALAALDDQS